MIDKDFVLQVVEQEKDNNDIFVVDVKVGSGNKITVYIDKFNGGITLEDCEILHKKIYPIIEEQTDNFDLTVSSPGLDTNFKVWQQYYKNKGKEIVVTTTEGEKFTAKVIDADKEKVILQIKDKEVTFTYNQISKAKEHFKF